MTNSDTWPEVALGEFAEINPARPVARGQEAPYVDMAALPEKARRIDPERVVRRVYRGGAPGSGTATLRVHRSLLQPPQAPLSAGVPISG